MRRSLTLTFAAGAFLALAVPMLAGGFWVMLGNPEASPEARAMHAVLTVKSTGCMASAETKFSGMAFGIVDGKRQTIPLKLAPLSEPGMFALTRQWPERGKWVVEIVGTNHSAVVSALITAGPDGLDRLSAKLTGGKHSDAEVDALLREEPKTLRSGL